MHSKLLQFYQRDDTSLLKEFLINISIFNEINWFIGSTMFNLLLEKIQIRKLSVGIPLELYTNSTYVFLCSGTIMTKKDRLNPQNKINKLRQLNKLNPNVSHKQIEFKKNYDFVQNKKQIQKVKIILTNDVYNEYLIFNPKEINTISQQEFMMNEDKQSAVIVLNHDNFPAQIHSLINQKYNQKLKFISSNQIFQHIQKNIIQPNLYKFKVIKVYFEEYLMRNSNLRSEYIFFLMNGEVEICNKISNNQKRMYRLKAPCFFGLQNDILYAKSTTQICVGYHIERKQIIDILKKSLDNRQRNSDTQQLTKQLIKSLTNDKLQLKSKKIIELSSHDTTPRQNITTQEDNYREQRNNTSIYYTNDKIGMNRQKSTLLRTMNNKINENKKFRIKEHFTNFINDRYSEFAQKKTQFLNRKSQNYDNVLYEMKSLISRPPEMTSINDKLRQQRLKRIIRCKQNIQIAKQENSTSINLRKFQQFQEIKILSKIRRKLQFDIHKKQIKNKIQKTFTPNNCSFNKLSNKNQLFC